MKKSKQSIKRRRRRREQQQRQQQEQDIQRPTLDFIATLPNVDCIVDNEKTGQTSYATLVNKHRRRSPILKVYRYLSSAAEESKLTIAWLDNVVCDRRMKAVACDINTFAQECVTGIVTTPKFIIDAVTNNKIVDDIYRLLYMFHNYKCPTPTNAPCLMPLHYDATRLKRITLSSVIPNQSVMVMHDITTKYIIEGGHIHIGDIGFIINAWQGVNKQFKCKGLNDIDEVYKLIVGQYGGEPRHDIPLGPCSRCRKNNRTKCRHLGVGDGIEGIQLSLIGRSLVANSDMDNYVLEPILNAITSRYLYVAKRGEPKAITIDDFKTVAEHYWLSDKQAIRPKWGCEPNDDHFYMAAGKLGRIGRKGVIYGISLTKAGRKIVKNEE